MQELKAVLSVSELARMANLSRHQMARLLRRSEVVFHRNGRKRLIYLSELKRAMPTLWESIQDYSGLS